MGKKGRRAARETTSALVCLPKIKLQVVATAFSTTEIGKKAFYKQIITRALESKSVRNYHHVSSRYLVKLYFL